MTRATQSLANPSARSYREVLAKLLRLNAIPQLRKIIDKTLAADISPVLPLLTADERPRILTLLSEAGKAGRVLLELESEDVRAIVQEIDDQLLAQICASSASDDAADLLDMVDEERRDRILERIGGATGAKLESLLEQEEPTAGALMTTDYLALGQELTVAEAIGQIRSYPKKDSFFYVYTVDADDQLVGVLSLRSLILANPATRLKQIMVHHVVRATVDDLQEEVAQLVAKYDLLSVPVVDQQNRLLGVVTVDDVLDVIQEEAEEDLYHLSGLDLSERVGSPAIASFRRRFPWLAINLVTAFVAASVVRMFQGTIEQWSALAVFMPVVAGLGGNSATQTLTVFVRGLAFGEVGWSTGIRPVMRQVMIGLANGVSIGTLTMLIVGLWTGEWILGFVLLGAMIVNLLLAGIAGGLVPLALEALGFDPAISSSIFVTAVTDVGGFFSFLGLATIAMHFVAR
jgi:magnesium transporter